jgi:hypothetical protein
MTTVSTELAAHLSQDVTTLTTCWHLTRSDGVVMRFTAHDEDIVIADTSDGVEGTYASGESYTSSSVSDNIDLSVDNMDVYGILSSTGVLDTDLEGGVYDGAEIKIFLVNWQSPSDGIIKMRRGWLGEVTIQDGQYIAEMRGMAQALQQTIGRSYLPSCDAQVGDSRCGVRLDVSTWEATTSYTEREAGSAETGSIVKPSVDNERFYYCLVGGTSGSTEPTWDTGIGGETTDGDITWVTIQALSIGSTVTSVTSRQKFNDSSRTEDDDWYVGGVITWTSGLNSGLSMEIKAFSSSGFTLSLPMPNDIAISDGFTVTAGCQKRSADCVGKFDNVLNFRGFPEIPGRDEVLSYGQK